MIVQFFDPELGRMVDTYQAAKCECGAKLSVYEIETFGKVCESCANHYEEQYRMANESNEA